MREISSPWIYVQPNKRHNTHESSRNISVFIFTDQVRGNHSGIWSTDFITYSS